MVSIGILRESAPYFDPRVAITPATIQQLKKYSNNFQFTVQPSKHRIYSDVEYEKAGAQINESLQSCDIIFGIKRPATATLLEGKTYLFFAHIAKMQTNNSAYLQHLIAKKITLIDYEYLTDQNGHRLVQFGNWAGEAGVLYMLQAIEKRYQLKLANYHHLNEIHEIIIHAEKIALPNVKILVTGNGKTAHGALASLKKLRIQKVTAHEFMHNNYEEAVYCHLTTRDYIKSKTKQTFVKQHFYNHPEEYDSDFEKFTSCADIFLACHYWTPNSPPFFTKETLQNTDFNIRIIVDVSCDLNGPIPTSIFETSHTNPFYDYNIKSHKIEAPFSGPQNVTVATIGNLPALFAKDASKYFSKQLLKNVLLEFEKQKSPLLENGTLIKAGTLKFNL